MDIYDVPFVHLLFFSKNENQKIMCDAELFFKIENKNKNKNRKPKTKTEHRKQFLTNCQRKMPSAISHY
jgi:hypothetical protein